ncbi:MAG: CHAD domain-containing protein [Sulfuricurvum sp.]|uniref:CHAD domain-containing protein n=1 Tax=Sulfuricurvum sp. TaxID=2025608 RepID=UPI002638024A|nr:CHAD domain-containing protein [Sulfuricurvum sp.]MDD2828887.1 CHAD domain-containing protein [Sulfuricurvum sp.]MDD4948550.1 CHAD domain-containing protein [Sulfuricurvum sp.]
MKPHKLTQFLLYQLYHARVLLHSNNGKEEQIHEFRVTLRSIRSLVKLFLNDVTPFPKILKTAMQETNSIRELDVLINTLKRSQYPKLFKHLKKLRKQSVKTLFTPQYHTKTLLLIEEYSYLISQYEPDFISEILIQKVLTHYQHCLDSYLALESNATPKMLHQLRIEFKDARYGFEFLEISDLHQCSEVIAHCKELQNMLGSIQDTVNQIDLLKKIYLEFPSPEVKELLKKQKKVLQKLKETTQSELSVSI